MTVLYRFSIPEHLLPGDHKPERSLGFWQILGILYLSTCCGAYATEELVEAGGGPLLCLTGLVVLPWVWGIPTALGVAELATSMPSNGGVLVWVNCTYHASLTCTVAICTLFMNVVDNAIYPHLCADYFLQVIGPQPDWVSHFCKIVAVCISCVLNILGVGAVGDASAMFMFLCLLPFSLLFAFGVPLLEPRHWLDHGFGKDVHWGKVISMLTWNLCGFDAAGHVVEEIKDPQKDFPRAVLGCLVVTTLTLTLPILVGSSVDQDYPEWEDGYWSVIAAKVGGRGLQLIMGLGGCCSGFGLLLSYLCTTSRATSSTATMGIYPDCINRQLGLLSTRGTPARAIVFMSILTMVLSISLDFSELVAVSSFFYAARLLLVLIAIPTLRFRYPALPRPYQLPCGPWGLVLLISFPVCFCLLNLVACAHLSFMTLILGPLLVTMSLVFSVVYVRYAKPHGFQGVIKETPAADLMELADPAVEEMVAKANARTRLMAPKDGHGALR